jgi:hypothetical protein
MPKSKINIPLLTQYFAGNSDRAFSLSDLGSLFVDKAQEWNLPASMTQQTFVEMLLRRTKLRELRVACQAIRRSCGTAGERISRPFLSPSRLRTTHSFLTVLQCGFMAWAKTRKTYSSTANNLRSHEIQVGLRRMPFIVHSRINKDVASGFTNTNAQRLPFSTENILDEWTLVPPQAHRATKSRSLLLKELSLISRCALDIPVMFEPSFTHSVSPKAESQSTN